MSTAHLFWNVDNFERLENARVHTAGNAPTETTTKTRKSKGTNGIYLVILDAR